MESNNCCFIGHRKICKNEEMKAKLRETIERLITEENVDTFIFGSKSEFDDLCYELVTEIKKEKPYIKRIYVRAEYQYINEKYKNSLLKSYEDTYYPEKIIVAGKSAYVERNCEMIDKSGFCVMYFNCRKRYENRRSGTKIAYEYAVKRGKKIINIAEV